MVTTTPTISTWNSVHISENKHLFCWIIEIIYKVAARNLTDLSFLIPCAYLNEIILLAGIYPNLFWNATTYGFASIEHTEHLIIF